MNDQVTKEHNATFAAWFKELLTKEPLAPGTENATLIFSLANSPTCNLTTYQAYDINGYTFYIEDKDKNSDYQN
jgi:hypothetical protein